ncbi:MAG: beta-lactamase family protein, partial [Deltaproteobacteria bacterium]|nr:beta-lactamase family protein [Deltaproteobacteria bacterium]
MNRTTKINFSRNWRLELDQLMESALRQRIFPGLELLVAKEDEPLLHQTWGRLEISPESPDLAPGTLWDIASITKPVATATSMMILLEKGILSLEDKVAETFPEFDTEDKKGITLRHLLTHTSGLPAWVDLYQESTGQGEALQKLLHTPLKTPTGTAMIYSDLNFLLLGEMVRRGSGQSLSEFFHQNVAHPLLLNHTLFNPLDSGWDQTPVAPTQYCPFRKQLLRGVVHDENAYIFGGEGGNAGLFSTALDLARFARMIQEGGSLDGVRVLSSVTVELMISNQNPPRLAPRGLGWDMKGEGFGYMSCGDLMPPGTVGHTGFTGTSLWMDPHSGLTIIALSNRVHISREKN